MFVALGLYIMCAIILCLLITAVDFKLQSVLTLVKLGYVLDVLAGPSGRAV